MPRDPDLIFARLMVQSPTVSAPEITRRLRIEPSSHHARDEMANPKTGKRFESHNWRLDSDSSGRVASRDAAHHVNWMLDLLERLRDQIKSLRDDGATITLLVYWGPCGSHSAWEAGGREARRTLTAEQMLRVEALNIDYGENYNLSLGPD